MTTAADPTKHLIGYGRRDQTTGMLHGHIRWPHGTAPTPFGCRWCGCEKGHHGRRFMPRRGIHGWEQPTQAQILARMKARRAAHLNSEPTLYHATTAWAADHTGESADPYCADCKTDGCPRWSRIQTRLDQQRWGLPRRVRRSRKPGGWGGGEPW